MPRTAKSQPRRSPFELMQPIKEFFGRTGFFFMILFCVAVLIFGRLQPEVIGGFRSQVADVTTPVLTAIGSPVRAWRVMKREFSGLLFLKEENERLREENDRLLKLQVLIVEMESENRRLREAIRFVPEQAYQFLTARVVGRTGGPFLESAIISGGSSVGLRKGQIVTNENGLVGRITEVGERSARVLLITDINSRVPVMTELSTQRSILRGTSPVSATLLYLTDHSAIVRNERVVTSGDGGFFPSGIPVGIVNNVTSKRVDVQPFVDLNRLDMVTIFDPVQPVPSE